MKYTEIKDIIGKFVVVRQHTNGEVRTGIFQVKNYHDFPTTYKVVLEPVEPFEEVFNTNDIYSMDLAGMVDRNRNVFSTVQEALVYYNSDSH